MLSARPGENRSFIQLHNNVTFTKRAPKQLRQITLIIASIEVYPKLHSVGPGQ